MIVEKNSKPQTRLRPLWELARECDLTFTIDVD